MPTIKNNNEAIDLIYEGLVGLNSIPTDLRMRKGIDYSKLENIRKAIKFLIKSYSDKDEVPKRLALAFIDIYGAFQFKKGFYSDEKLLEYEDIGIELQELAYELLG